MPLCKLEIIDAIIQPKVIVPEDAWLGSLKAFQPDPQQWVPRPLQKEVARGRCSAAAASILIGITGGETPIEDQLAALRLRVEELSAISPSTRRAPGSHEEEDPTMMSGGVGGPVNPSANAGSPYVRSGPTNDPVARRRADRAAEEDRRLALLRNQEEYDLLHARSPRVGSAARGRDHVSLADRTRRPYAVGPAERERRRREFDAGKLVAWLEESPRSLLQL
ncbi:hypothetical protein D6D25_02258 [Aureobasidium pullulans]|nr:hypothetical protein D6D25_02258 [Aureobasidium pullulans]